MLRVKGGNAMKPLQPLLFQQAHVFERLNQARATLDGLVSLSSELGFARWSNKDDRTAYQRPEHHTLSVYLSGGYQTKRQLGSQLIDGGAPGKICLMPAGHESQWQVDGELAFVHLYFSEQSLRDEIERVWDKDARDLSLQELTFADDPAISSLVQQWLLSLNWSDKADFLALQQVGQLLLNHIAKQYSSRPLAPLELKSGLAPFQLQRCKDYIEAHLAQNISLQDLAALVGLSEYHFARMFKHSCGLSPHRYVSERRVALAKRLLQLADLSLSEIAYQSGFSSQAHFSARFKQLTGYSPKAYREALA
jgi:AraC family transcriptional regulator